MLSCSLVPCMTKSRLFFYHICWAGDAGSFAVFFFVRFLLIVGLYSGSVVGYFKDEFI
jgi:hypothetical protein